MDDSSDSLSIIQEQLRRYGGNQKLAGEYRMVRCAFHEDQDPSMGVYLRRDHPKKTLGWFNCFAQETRVITRNGVFEIADIIGKPVEVLTRGSKWVRTVFQSYGTQRLYKITLKNFTRRKTVYATADHTWHIVANGRRGPFFKTGTLTTKELVYNTKLETVSAPVRANYIPDRVGIQHGFVFGDGTVKRNKTIAYFCGEKRELAEYFSEYTDYVYDYGYRLQIGGLPPHWKTLPSLEETDEYLLGFLAGLMAADGCVSKKGGTTISNTSPEVLAFIQALAIRFGIHTNEIKTKIRNTNYAQAASLSSIKFKGFPRSLILRSAHFKNTSSRKIDRKNEWRVLSVEKTKRVEEVFCCNVPKTHTFALEGNILTGNCLGCGAHGPWNVFAEKAGLTPIKSWNSGEKKVEYNAQKEESNLLGDTGVTLRAVYKEMHCPEAQPWPENLTWRGVSGQLIAAVGGKAINDEYNDGIAVLFPIKIGKRIRGAVKAMFQKKTPTSLGYITMAGEWVKRYGIFPYAYTSKLIQEYGHTFVILVEGPRDALRLLKMGLPAVAVLGANTISKTKLLYIESLGVDTVYVLPDNDRGGTALWRNIKQLLPEARRLKLPREKDKNGKIIKMDPFSMPVSIAREIKKMMRERHDWRNPRRPEQYGATEDTHSVVAQVRRKRDE